MPYISFDNISYLILLLTIPLLLFLYIKFKDKYFIVLKTSIIDNRKTKLTHLIMHLPFITLISSITLIILALSGPHTLSSITDKKYEAIDIIVAVDVSTSMLADDFKPNRLEVSKSIINSFIDNRQHDRIGIVAFAGESFTQSPLTRDKKTLKVLINSLYAGMLADGTALGVGLSSAIAKFKGSNSKSKVIILLTDGVNNTGIISPETSLELAKSSGIKIYSIGIGDPYSEDYDAEFLNSAAQISAGMYYNADNPEALNNIYNKIDQLEKNTIIEKQSVQSIYYSNILIYISIIMLIIYLSIRAFYIGIKA